ncbi:MAG: hypothetical protein OXF88_02830 [Rhodobacteraceae bacterium]|nr:hypothetical protein [Paracoccaceae bacterium]MCY4139121.1 hypothetical protein [Paracoccaceae bacterium]
MHELQMLDYCLRVAYHANNDVLHGLQMLDHRLRVAFDTAARELEAAGMDQGPVPTSSARIPNLPIGRNLL